MTLLRLAWSSLRHYRRTHIAVALGVAAAVAVLAGAWLVGASVRDSLAALTSRRLGRTRVVVGSPNLFPAALADRLAGALGPGAQPAPVALLTLEGIARHEASGRRASRVAIYGIDARFGAFHGVSLPAPGGSDALVSPDLADELGADGDDVIVIRVARPTDVPIDSLHGDKEDTGRSIRLRLSGVVEPESLGEFSLAPSQGPVRAVFVSLDRLQGDLGQPGLVNTILIAGDETATGDQAPAARQALARSIGPDDLGLTFTPIAGSGAVVVESKAGLIPDSMVAPISAAAQANGSTAPTAVLSWLATRMTIGDRVVPYSLVTAIGPDAGGDATLARLLATSGLASTPIVLNDWTARELDASAGDTLELEYYRWADEGRLETARTTFTIAGVVPIAGVAADRRLAPEYPGITDAKSFADWTPPFPIDLRLVRPVDEAYWDKFRATPKAFMPLEAGQRLWRTRYGQVTSLRIASAGSTDLPTLSANVARAAAATIDPLRAGFGVVDVRAQNLAASVGATDFGAYFSYFSFFLVISAVLLAALFFRLSVEQRLAEIGLLRAEGFSLAAIRTLFLIEAGIVAAAGAAIGTLVAIAWAGLMMYGLRTWWIGAVGTTSLTLHVDPAALAIGAVGGALAGLASIALTIRGLGRHSPRALIAGTALNVAAAPAPRARGLAAVALALAALLTAAGFFGLIPAVAAFFGAGALTLIGGLALFRVWLGRTRGVVLGASGRSGLVRLGLENASWRPGRSLTCAALVSSAVFLLVSVDAFRKGADEAAGPRSGTGGFALLGETALPFVQDPETREGRDALLLPAANDPDLAGVRLYAARLRPGEDTSCLNLYQPKQPRVVGVPQQFVDAGRFRFGATTATSDETRANPWRLLGLPDGDGVVPAIVDATSLQYVLHAAVGDQITIDADTDRPVRLRIVAALADSMLQGEIFVAEQAFLRLYPRNAGYRLLLVEVTAPTAERLDAVSTLLEDRLEPFGLDVENSARRLEAYHRVENTYLSTFQTLGGLGLVLGSLGLMAVIARNVLERRREIALLGAQGYTGRDLQTVVLAEHLALVAAGLVIGVGAAAVAILPVLIERSSGIPALPLFWIGAVAVTGVIASMVATRGVRRLPLVPSLRERVIVRPTSASWWGATAAFWLLVSLLSVAQILWLANRPGERINVTAAVIWQSSYFILWIPFTAIVWWLSERWPLSRLGWPRFLGTHGAAAMLVGAAQSAIAASLATTWVPMGNESVWTIVVSQIRSRMPTQVVIYVAALATAQASLLYDRWRHQQAEAMRLEAQLAEARLGALRAQLHPHVLFNGLHAIAALVRERRNDDAVRLISGMGDLLRRFLDAGDARVSLGDEVELTRQYLAIQQVRFGDRLSVRLDVDPAAEAARVPALIIQPLVENALRHGLAEKVEPGHIEVTARRDAGDLLVRVTDDGVGVADAWSEGQAQGTGLRNLRARLQAEFNGRASMQVRPGRDRRGGFDVELRLPWIDA